MKYETNTSAQALIAEIPRIAKDEGLVLSVYKCPTDHLTIGFGSLLVDGMPECGEPVGTPITEKRALQAFFTELYEKTYSDGPRVFGRHHWNKFPQEAKQVFYNMAFNLGAPRLSGFKRMIANAKAGNWNGAADEMLDSRYARQVKGRATRLAERLRGLAQ